MRINTSKEQGSSYLALFCVFSGKRRSVSFILFYSLFSVNTIKRTGTDTKLDLIIPTGCIS